VRRSDDRNGLGHQHAVAVGAHPRQRIVAHIQRSEVLRGAEGNHRCGSAGVAGVDREVGRIGRGIVGERERAALDVQRVVIAGAGATDEAERRCRRRLEAVKGIVTTSSGKAASCAPVFSVKLPMSV
jgi:hypothetical protein